MRNLWSGTIALAMLLATAGAGAGGYGGCQDHRQVSAFDNVAGGPGNDLLLTLDGPAENVDYGGGADSVLPDRRERLTSCERKLARPPRR